MNVDGKSIRTIQVKSMESGIVEIIDQRVLPHHFVLEELKSAQDVFTAISDMHVRGAPLIGVTAAYGVWLASLEQNLQDASWKNLLQEKAEWIRTARPTAVNLAWAVNLQVQQIFNSETLESCRQNLFKEANRICEEDVQSCFQIGQNGLQIFKQIVEKKKLENKKGPLQILTHCNAGWLACVDWGTATSPIYQAFNAGIDIHVWVDETRPRNQGASLTSWELKQHGVPHTVIADNVGGYLMQKGMVDCVITGADRISANGDVVNKIGTYLKALAAKEHGVPFWVAFPLSTLDPNINNGNEIPIEERSENEVRFVHGKDETGKMTKVQIVAEGVSTLNPAFDMTPAKYVTGLLTERGNCIASREGLQTIFPEVIYE